MAGGYSRPFGKGCPAYVPAYSVSSWLPVVLHHLHDGDDVGKRNKYKRSCRRDGKGLDGRKASRDLEEDARKPDGAAPKDAHGQAGYFNAVGRLLGNEVGSGVGGSDGEQAEADKGDEA